jgi:hypothetical protein
MLIILNSDSGKKKSYIFFIAEAHTNLKHGKRAILKKGYRLQMGNWNFYDYCCVV